MFLEGLLGYCMIFKNFTKTTSFTRIDSKRILNVSINLYSNTLKEVKISLLPIIRLFKCQIPGFDQAISIDFKADYVRPSEEIQKISVVHGSSTTSNRSKVQNDIESQLSLQMKMLMKYQLQLTWNIHNILVMNYLPLKRYVRKLLSSLNTTKVSGTRQSAPQATVRISQHCRMTAMYDLQQFVCNRSSSRWMEDCHYYSFVKKK